MAPPLTLSFSSGMFRSFWNFSTTEAKASFSSNRSMSSTVRPARSSTLLGGRGRAGQHDDRVGTTGGGGHDAGARGQALRLARRLGADEHQRGAVDDARAVAAGVDVVDLLDVVVLLQRHVVEAAHRADAVERGLQLAEALQGRGGTHVLVVVEDDEAVLVLDRHDGLGEVAARPVPRPRSPASAPRRRRRPRGRSPRWWRSGRRRCPAGRSRCGSWSPGRWPRRRRRSPSGRGSSTRRRRRAPGRPSRSAPSARQC